MDSSPTILQLFSTMATVCQQKSSSKSWQTTANGLGGTMATKWQVPMVSRSSCPQRDSAIVTVNWINPGKTVRIGHPPLLRSIGRVHSPLHRPTGGLETLKNALVIQCASSRTSKECVAGALCPPSSSSASTPCQWTGDILSGKPVWPPSICTDSRKTSHSSSLRLDFQKIVVSLSH